MIFHGPNDSLRTLTTPQRAKKKRGTRNAQPRSLRMLFTSTGNAYLLAVPDSRRIVRIAGFVDKYKHSAIPYFSWCVSPVELGFPFDRSRL